MYDEAILILGLTDEMAQAKIRKEFLTQMDARISRDECAEIIRLSAAKARPGTNLSNRARCCESGYCRTCIPYRK
jgi:hypothetical protein